MASNVTGASRTTRESSAPTDNGAGIASVVFNIAGELPTASGHFGNISTRLSVGTGDNVLIGGFIMTGPTGSTKKVMLRGIGPTLNVNGVPIPGRVADPFLALHKPDGSVETNDDWRDTLNVGEIPNGFTPSDDLIGSSDLQRLIVRACGIKRGGVFYLS